MARGNHSAPRSRNPRQKRMFLFGGIAVVVMVCIIAACFAIHTVLTSGNSDDSLLINNISAKYSENTGSKSSATANSISGSSPAASMSAETKQLESDIQQLVAQYGDDVAVAVQPFDGSQGFSINGSERLVSASMIKLLILAEFMDEVDKGQLRLDEVYTRDDADVVGGTGKMQSDASGTTYTYDELARLMIAYSDNTATNILIDRMGMDRINAKARELKLQQTDLQRKMMQLDSGVENHISADDTMTILRGIKDRTLASDAMCQKAEEYLRAQTDDEGLRQGVPAAVAFGHKTGSLDSVRHDAGIVYSGKPYGICVLTKLGSSTANSLMEKISSMAYGALQ